MECYEKVAMVFSVLFQFVGVVFLGIAGVGICLIGTAAVILVTSVP